MDNRTQRQRQAVRQKQAERQKYLRIQRLIRIGCIALALLLALISLMQSCSTRRAIDDLAAQIRAKKLAQAQEELLQAQATPTPSPSPEAVQGKQVTLSFVGETALGIDDAVIERGEGGDLFQGYYENYGEDYFFQNVKSIFEGDDLTTANLVSSLTSSTESRLNWNEAYRGEPSYGWILAGGGIDAADVAGDHLYDFDYEGYVDTLANLDNSEVGRFGLENTMLRTLPGGISVGYVGVWEHSSDYYETMALDNIASLKEEGAQIIIVEVAWDSKNTDIPDDSQILTAHKFIDNGADLVVGVQPYILQGIEYYHDKYIVYSLGTFLSCSEEPESMDSIIFQQTFTISGKEVLPEADYELIPCSISSGDSNDCCPTPLTGTEAQRIIDHIYDCSAELDGGVSPKEE